MKGMIAFDHMRLRLSGFEWTWQLLDVYEKCFKNDETE